MGINCNQNSKELIELTYDLINIIKSSTYNNFIATQVKDLLTLLISTKNYFDPISIQFVSLIFSTEYINNTEIRLLINKIFLDIALINFEDTYESRILTPSEEQYFILDGNNLKAKNVADTITIISFQEKENDKIYKKTYYLNEDKYVIKEEKQEINETLTRPYSGEHNLNYTKEEYEELKNKIFSQIKDTTIEE